jgi:protein-tyrosine phosphatase
MTEAFPRRLALEGAVNFRDLGGYPAGPGRRTRWRRLFRSDNLGALTQADVAEIADLGIAGLVDFRLEIERRMHPNRLPYGGPRTLELGFLPVGTLEMLSRVRAGKITVAEIEAEVISHYRRFVTDHAEIYSRMIAFAADPSNHPLLIHCTSGKDRTGFGSAVLLRALGVPRETVEQDYLLTNQYIRDVSHLFGPQTPREIVDWLLSAQQSYIHAALDEIDARFGGIDGYLAEGLGVDPATRARLAELLTEEASA